MFVSAFNQQLGIDRGGVFLIGRLPVPSWRLPWHADPHASERGFLARYRAFLQDERESVRHRIAELQAPEIRR